MRDKRYYTQAELDTIRRLRAQGLTYRVIGERLGRTPRCLIQTMHRPPKEPIDARLKRREALAVAFVAGARITDLAVATGLSKQGICKALEASGFDREMRAMARAELTGGA